MTGWPMLIACLYVAGFLWTLVTLMLAFRQRSDEVLSMLSGVLPDSVVAVVLAVVFLFMAVAWPVVLPLAHRKDRP